MWVKILCTCTISWAVENPKVIDVVIDRVIVDVQRLIWVQPIVKSLIEEQTWRAWAGVIVQNLFSIRHYLMLMHSNDRHMDVLLFLLLQYRYGLLLDLLLIKENRFVIFFAFSFSYHWSMSNIEQRFQWISFLLFGHSFLKFIGFLSLFFQCSLLEHFFLLPEIQMFSNQTDTYEAHNTFAFTFNILLALCKLFLLIIY